MTIDKIMQDNAGVWENDIATVRSGSYFVQLAKRANGVVTVTDEGLRAFPELAVKPAEPEMKPAEPEMKPAPVADKKPATKKA